MTPKITKSLVLAILFLGFTTGCAVNKSTADITPGTTFSTDSKAYVIKHDKDEKGVNELVQAELYEYGFETQTGATDEAPAEADIIVEYIDRWQWDMTMYMIELSIKIKDASSGFTLANGNSMHTSLTRKSPENMVKEVLGNIMAKTGLGKESDTEQGINNEAE